MTPDRKEEYWAAYTPATLPPIDDPSKWNGFLSRPMLCTNCTEETRAQRDTTSFVFITYFEGKPKATFDPQQYDSSFISMESHTEKIQASRPMECAHIECNIKTGRWTDDMAVLRCFQVAIQSTAAKLHWPKKYFPLDCDTKNYKVFKTVDKTTAT